MPILTSDSQVDNTVADELTIKLTQEEFLARRINSLFRDIVRQQGNNLRVFGSVENLNSFSPEIEEILVNHYTGVMTIFANNLVGQSLQNARPESIFMFQQLMRDNISNYALSQAVTHSDIITQTNQRDLEKAINATQGLASESIIRGDGQIDFPEEFEHEYFDELDDRVNTIAITETQNAAEQAKIDSVDALIASGVIAASAIRKQWNTILDGREREWHNEADGQTQEVGIPFIVKGEQLQRPGDATNASLDNIINCRCTVTYTMLDAGVVNRDASGNVTF